MKKAFISILILLLNIVSYAQIYKYRAFQSAMVPTDEEVRKNTSTTWDSTNILIVINRDKYKVHIYAEKETDVDIVRLIETYPDKKEKEATWIIEQGVDQEGRDCKIITKQIAAQSSAYTAVLFLEYSVATYIFKLKKND